MKKIILSLLLAIPLGTAHAGLFGVYDFSYTDTAGDVYSGSVTLDQALLASAVNPRVPSYVQPDRTYSWNLFNSALVSYNATLKDSSGTLLQTFGKSDIDTFYVGTNNGSSVDLTQDLSKSHFTMTYFRGPAIFNLLGTYTENTNYYGEQTVQGNGWINVQGNSLKFTGGFTSGVLAVPEPSSWLLGLGGLIGLTVLGTSRRKKVVAV